VLAPANTPKDITRKLSAAIAKALHSEDLKPRMVEFGQEPVGSTPEELAAGIRTDGEIFDRAIKAANIKVDQN
jgi:tripartite-type tricarboxylate transporter receptor subunit TctC